MKLILWAFLASVVIYASSSFSNASLPRQSTLNIQFPNAVDAPIGTSVVLEGRRIGFLSSVSAAQDLFTIVLEEDSRLIRTGAMAVISSTWVPEKRQSVSFIEVLNPSSDELAEQAKPLAKGETLQLLGYENFESFWGNTEQQHWVDQAPTPLS